MMTQTSIRHAAFLLLLLASACAAPSDDPNVNDRRFCRSEGEVVRMQVEQQEANAAPRMPTQSGAMAPIGGSSAGFAAYRQAFEACMRARAAQRPPAAPRP
jgi:hypothetical protein